jgi:hypothetical protein
VRFWSGWGRTFGTNIQTCRRTMVSPPWQHAHAHITCSIPDFQKHCSDSPSHSPDLTPWDYFLFRFDEQNRKRLSTHIWELQGRMNWEAHWDRCIHAQGDYLEGDCGNWELR